MNRCEFTGRFTSNPRRKDTDKTSRCYFTLMVNKEGKRPDGTRHPAQAVDCVAWGSMADLICKYKVKGDLVLLTGEFFTYDIDPVDMNNNPIPNARKVQKPMFTVRNVEFLPSAGKGNSNNTNIQPNENFEINPNDIPDFDMGENNVDDPFNLNGGGDPYNLGVL